MTRLAAAALAAIIAAAAIVTAIRAVTNCDPVRRDGHALIVVDLPECRPTQGH